MSKEIGIQLSSGHNIFICEDKGGVIIGLANKNGYITSDTDLLDEEIKKLKEILRLNDLYRTAGFVKGIHDVIEDDSLSTEEKIQMITDLNARQLISMID